jgi:hypothetical protein
MDPYISVQSMIWILEALKRYRRITARHEWYERYKRVFKNMEARLHLSPLDFECYIRQWDKTAMRGYQYGLGI